MKKYSLFFLIFILNGMIFTNYAMEDVWLMQLRGGSSDDKDISEVIGHLEALSKKKKIIEDPTVADGKNFLWCDIPRYHLWDSMGQSDVGLEEIDSFIVATRSNVKALESTLKGLEVKSEICKRHITRYLNARERLLDESKVSSLALLRYAVPGATGGAAACCCAAGCGMTNPYMSILGAFGFVACWVSGSYCFHSNTYADCGECESGCYDSTIGPCSNDPECWPSESFGTKRRRYIQEAMSKIQEMKEDTQAIE